MGLGTGTATALFFVVVQEGTRAFHAIFSTKEGAQRYVDMVADPYVIEEAIVDTIDPYQPVNPVEAMEAHRAAGQVYTVEADPPEAAVPANVTIIAP